jgi:hypothetical protein
MYDRFGPTPRICFDYIKDPYAVLYHQTDLKTALQSLSSVTLRQMIDNTQHFRMDEISHTLILVKRMSKELKVLTWTDDSRSKASVHPRVEIISPVVESELRARLREQSRAELLELYRYLANVDTARSIASLAFEAWVNLC